MPQEQEPNKPSSLTQLNYKATTYADSKWEVLGELNEDPVFEPLEISVVSCSPTPVDPMFADYGGMHKDGAEKRAHLPAHLSTGRPTDKKKEEEAEEAKYHKFTDEQLAKLISDAEERGQMVALEKATEQQSVKLASIEKRMVDVIQDIGKQLNEQITVIEKESAELAVAISGKIFGEVVEINPEYIVKIIDEAIQQAGSALISKIRVSPEDMEFINLIGISKQLTTFDLKWQFEADPAIRAGCVVETSAGEIDYQLDKAWERVKTEVLKVIR